jgi:hypothetical protein
MMVGPERALAGHPEVRGRVRLAEPVAELGPVVAEHDVAESGVRSFVVPWHQLPDGRLVAANPAGGNQVSWDPAAWTDLGVTPADESHLTSVFVRYVLRHLTTTFLEQDLGGRSVHAVTAALGTGVLAVAGPTRSGKTRLVNALVTAGVVGAVVDDDCPVLAPDGSLGMLVPARYEVIPAVTRPLHTLVVLTDSDDVRRVDPEAAQRFLADTARPWPLRWLPDDGTRQLPLLPPDLRIIGAPAQSEDAYADVVRLLRAG